MKDYTDIIIAPVITEKSAADAEQNVYTFKVNKSANKIAIKDAIEIARGKLMLHRLNKSKSEQEILNFSATVVGVFYHRDKGVFFHIGDGAGIAVHSVKPLDYTLSHPVNGRFSCETYFYTMNNWRSNLRFTKINKPKK